MPVAYFDGCLTRFPADPGLLSDRGVALWRAGRRDASLASLRAALAADPGFLPAALSLEAALGGGAEARAALRRALARTKEPEDSPLRRQAERALKSRR
jgi:hypothetical protein